MSVLVVPSTCSVMAVWQARPSLSRIYWFTKYRRSFWMTVNMIVNRWKRSLPHRWLYPPETVPPLLISYPNAWVSPRPLIGASAQNSELRNAFQTFCGFDQVQTPQPAPYYRLYLSVDLDCEGQIVYPDTVIGTPRLMVGVLAHSRSHFEASHAVHVNVAP